ncbi:amino acid adenylation domain-containing protein [Streptomyces sp. DSM 41527]|uniref:Amino acid adenylation domain-containing protein n=1 Tax=Streptomyces mooreae TaxID=3075523 RepID=A0ABU2T053_9ACTN|nr:amino acid adenylation domain-containing protein [Streptomyces sp. DSM 41527]MDT0454465.1 amino acid adenylation domain-containing protein [Streptomyces sp. DSM 41527]
MTPSPTAPLSFSQERIWFLEQLTPGTALQNIPLAVRLTGDLEPAALTGALRGVLRRHDALRTAVTVVDGHPVQQVSDAVDLPVPLTDLSGPEAARVAAAAQDWLREQARTPIRLDRAPLMRAALARLGERHHMLAVTVHHIAFDGWSVGLLMRELGERYTAALNGRSAALPELPLRYADFAARQRAALTSGDMAGDLAHWRVELTGDLPVLELPTDHTRPETAAHRGATVSRVLPDDCADAVSALARAAGVTPYMVLLGGYATLLGRWGGQRSVVVGSPIAGRTSEDLEELIGFFVNSVALHIDLSGDPWFGELLRRVRKKALGAYAHQSVPFEKVVEELSPGREGNRAPLFQTMFVLQNAPADGLRLPGLEVRPLHVHNGTAKFDLLMSVSKLPEGLTVTLEYDTALFEEGTAARLLEQYETLLRGAAAAPDTPLSRLPLIDAHETARLLALGRSGERFPVHGTLHGTFEDQARRRPDAPALTFGAHHLSYAELNAKADALAARLRALGTGTGTGTESLVGLYLNRGLDTVISILAVLKAGAAYVPMDAAYPGRRVARILSDARPPVLVVHDALRDRLPEYDGHLLVVDGPDVPARRPATPPPSAPLGPDSAAYVIYTSGSTGTPKGVQITHANVLRLFAATREQYRFGHHDVWPLFHSYAFDVSVWELWGALLHGGRLVVVPDATARDAEAYRELVRAERVTVLNQTPSAFVHFSAADARHAPDELALRWIIFAGEALEPGSLKGWFARHGDRTPRLVNMYGITETTVHVTMREMTRDDVTLARRSPIGRPMPDLALYVLDGQLQPVPVGTTGELYVGGPGLARCYFGAPALTADRFAPDPFGTMPGGRLYRSGDLARITPEGEIEYLGRADHQIKVRGYRIEAGEIESQLLDHPAVDSAVVVPQRDPGGDLRLLAYVTGDGQQVSGDALRDLLAERLPAYMLPWRVVVLDTLPLTVNGKVDRAALPEPGGDRLAVATAYAEPRDATEQAVADAFAAVLGLDRVGIQDNFFDLGGHSLLATRLVFRLRDELSTEVPLRTLFEVPTVGGIAAAVRRSSGSGGPAHDPTRVLTADAQPPGGLTGFGTPAPQVLNKPTDVLLTGTTGFLGAFLLRELLRTTDADVHCLVRAEDGGRARQRIEATARRYGVWDEETARRIRPVVGDLSAPGLGLAAQEADRLAHTMDAIYHCGAAVNLVYPYEQLKAANVDGTKELVWLADRSGRAPLHYLSTVGVFAAPPAHGGAARETDVTGPAGQLRQGYTQSKWVGEQIVLKAAAAGLPVTVHRPSRIAGDSRSGACQTDDYLWRVIKGCVQAGAYPADARVMIDLVPVDHVSAAVVALSHDPRAIGRVHHLVNPHPVPLSEVLGHVRAFGYELAGLPFTEWARAVAADADNAAYPLLGVLEGGAGADGGLRFAQDDTAALLDATPIRCPALDADLMHRYLTHFVRTGFLPTTA